MFDFFDEIDELFDGSDCFEVCDDFLDEGDAVECVWHSYLNIWFTFDHSHARE